MLEEISASTEFLYSLIWPPPTSSEMAEEGVTAPGN